jgi:hypothetical protein
MVKKFEPVLVELRIRLCRELIEDLPLRMHILQQIIQVLLILADLQVIRPPSVLLEYGPELLPVTHELLGDKV